MFTEAGVRLMLGVRLIWVPLNTGFTLFVYVHLPWFLPHFSFVQCSLHDKSHRPVVSICRLVSNFSGKLVTILAGDER